MDDILLVAVVQCCCKVENVLRSSELAEPALSDELLVELSLRCKLEDEVNALKVVEVRVKAEDVRVPKI